MRSKALYTILKYGVLVIFANCQYQQPQQNGFQSVGGVQQQGGFQQNSFQSGRGRYQQTHVVVGPGPISPNNGGQYKEQRLINIQENIQGTNQQAAQGYQYGASSYQGGSANGYGWQAGYGQGRAGQQGAMSGRSVVVNTPIVLDATATGIKGAQVDLRLVSYTNSGLRLPNSTTCNCPTSYCNFIPSNQQNQCQFSFVTVISCADQSIQYTQSNFYPVSSNGVMTTGNWTNQYTFYMNTKPVAIDFFVQHLGVVIDMTGHLLFFNHLTLVDSFVVDLSKFNGENIAQGSQSLSLIGQNQQTQLQISLNVQCINNMLGPYCDLSCNNTNAQPNQAVVCYSNRTSTYSSCRWNTYKTQVVDCYVCTHGQYNGTCAGAVVVNNWGVSYAFRTWTIVLGCLLGIALLLILCLILSYIICFRVLNRREENEYVHHRSDYTNDSGSNQPLVNEEWSNSKTVKKPIGILTKRDNETTQIIPPRQSIAQNQNYRPQQDSPDTEESYLTNGQLQQTTTTTTTTRREHVV